MTGEMTGATLTEETIAEMTGDLTTEEMIAETTEEMIEMSALVLLSRVATWTSGEHNFFIFDFLSKLLVTLVW